MLYFREAVSLVGILFSATHNALSPLMSVSHFSAYPSFCIIHYINKSHSFFAVFKHLLRHFLGEPSTIQLSLDKISKNNLSRTSSVLFYLQSLCAPKQCCPFHNTELYILQTVLLPELFFHWQRNQ